MTVPGKPNRAEIPIPIDIHIDSFKIRPTIIEMIIIKTAPRNKVVKIVGSKLSSNSGVASAHELNTTTVIPARATP